MLLSSKSFFFFRYLILLQAKNDEKLNFIFNDLNTKCIYHLSGYIFSTRISFITSLSNCRKNEKSNILQSNRVLINVNSRSFNKLHFGIAGVWSGASQKTEPTKGIYRADEGKKGRGEKESERVKWTRKLITCDEKDPDDREAHVQAPQWNGD